MGRKGVSKRKKAKEKGAPISGSNLASTARMAETQLEQVAEKVKASPKDKKKH